MALADFINKIPPQALMGLAQGLLSPGPTQGARFGAGLAGMQQGMVVSQLMEERQQRLDRQKQQLESLKRFEDPNAYEDTETNVTAPAVSRGGMTVPAATHTMSTPSKYSLQSDLVNIAPEAAVSALLKEREYDNFLDQDSGQVLMLTSGQSGALNKHFPGRYVKTGPAPQRDSSLDQKVNMLVDTGLPENIAKGIAAGRYNVSVNPVDGSRVVVDIGGQLVGNFPAGGGGAAPGGDTTPPGSEEMPPLLGLVGNLGGTSAVGEAAGKYSMGGYDAGPVINRSRQKFRLLNQSIYQMYGGSKLSNEDRQKLDATLPSQSIFESPERAYDTLTEWHAKAQGTVSQQQAILDNPNNPPEMRKDAAAQIAGAREVMRIVGSPQNIARPKGGGQSQALPPGINAQTPKILGPGGETGYLHNGKWERYDAQRNMWVPIK